MKIPKAKLIGVALMFCGLATLAWLAVIVLLTKGMMAIFYGIIPLAAGWLIFHSAGTGQNQTAGGWKEEIKTGFERIRSFLKGLL